MKDNKRLLLATVIAAAIAIPAEGVRQYAYRDPVGIITVCYGKTGRIDTGKRYTLAECKTMLDADMLKAIETVDRCVPNLPENALAAFGDAVYNMGPTIVCDPKKSTAARLLKAGNVTAACNELPKWNKAKVGDMVIALPGLTKRRQEEKNLCLRRGV